NLPCQYPPPKFLNLKSVKLATLKLFVTVHGKYNFRLVLFFLYYCLMLRTCYPRSGRRPFAERSRRR
ncbi:MAG: hypothetical protein LBB88_01465, partial [Planctomycetaceae bacterium]|nr:hypothetical protein [Planctomycetaceae bacterium]